jgi:PPM family protein phosphatase
MIIELFAKSDIGMVRQGNEDNYLLLDLSTEKSWTCTDGDEAPPEFKNLEVGKGGIVLVVSDGMGGALAGEVASRMSVETVRDVLLGNDPNITYSPDENKSLIDGLLRATIIANSEIHHLGQDEPQYNGMGATFTGAAVKDELIDFVQVGDSRGYIIRGEEIKQTTKDQSLVQQLIDVNQISEEEAETHMLRNVILQALGAQSEIAPVSCRVRVKRGDTVLLCSDGLSGKLRAEDMLGIVRKNENDLVAACDELVNEANNRGGEDNITVILARFTGDDLVEPNGERISIELPSLEDDTTLGD